MFEINLTCPNCGSFTWETGDAGTFICTDCGAVCKIEEMEHQCFTGR